MEYTYQLLQSRQVSKLIKEILKRHWTLEDETDDYDANYWYVNTE